jgi:ribose transport system substrate-binding protein
LPLLAAAVVLLLSACEPAQPPVAEIDRGAAGTDDATPSVALVMKTLTNPFFVAMEQGAREAEREFDIELIVKTAAQETSIEQQIGIVDELIREGVDAIVIAPGDSIELIPVLKKARDAGIVVVNIDNRLDPGFARKTGLGEVPFISVDNERSAFASAAYIARRASPPAKAVVMEGIRSALNAEMRLQGALAAFAGHPGIEVVETGSAHWKIDEAQQLMREWLVRHPDIELVFAANDMMALGVIAALREARRDDVLVAGYDALDEAREAIRANELQVTVDQQPARQGYLGVQFAVRMMRGESAPAEHRVDTILVTADNVDAR